MAFESRRELRDADRVSREQSSSGPPRPTQAEMDATARRLLAGLAHAVHDARATSLSADERRQVNGYLRQIEEAVHAR